MKLTPLLQGVDIAEDLGIPLSYDAAWKIFNRWPQEVRMKHKPLGQKKTPSKSAFCFCAQKNCNTRCPFFGLCKKSEGNTEEKLNGIMSHAEGARDETAYKDLLDSINKWYNTRCAAGSSQVLDLSKLEQLKIKYKVPAYSVCRTNCSGRRRREYRSTLYHSNEHSTQSKPTSDAGSSGKGKKRSKNSDLRDTTELYYTIEKQLRNLSVSQSRLKQMSVSLCRLAYARKLGSSTKLKPKVYKRRESRNRYRYDIPIACNSTSDSCGYADAGKINVNTRKKLSKKSKIGKSSDTSKSGKTSDSSKSSKNTSQTDKSRSSKRSETSKTSRTSESSKDTKSSKTTESSRATKSSKTTESSRVTKSSKTTESSRSTESSKTSGSNGTSESGKTGPSSKRSRGGRTSDSSRTSGSYKSSKSGKNARFSRDSETSKTSGSGGISKAGRKSGMTSGSGRSSETSKTGNGSRTIDTSKTSGNNKSIETSESIKPNTSLETGRSLDTSEILDSNQCVATSPHSLQIDSTGFTSTNAANFSERSRNKRTKNSNKTTKPLQTHSIIKTLRFEIEKRSKRRSVRTIDAEQARSQYYKEPKIQKPCPKYDKPSIQRLGGGLGAYVGRVSGSSDTSHRYGTSVNRKGLPKPPTKYTPTEKITPPMHLAKSSYKRAVDCAVNSVNDDLRIRNKRKIVKKPSVRISKPILALFGKQRTPSKQMMALCGGRSRCFLIKGNRQRRMGA